MNTAPFMVPDHSILTMPRVVILSEILTHYRKPFFERLRESLATDGVELALVYGQPQGADRAKKHTTDLDWGHTLQNK